MRIKETKVYLFDELSDDAKEKAIEKLYDINVDYEWWDFVYEDAKEAGKLIGIDIDNIYFSGFSSQGDGACFEGDYEYKKGSVKAIMEFAPKDTELHRIAKDLQDLQKKCFYSISATVKQSGHYSHKYCTAISVDFENIHTANEYYNEESEDLITELLRDYMEWIYRRLEKEYECSTSKDAIIETVKTNEYEFTEDGALA